MAAFAAPRFSFEKAVPETATIGPRLGAFLIDLVLLFVLDLVVGAALVAGHVVEAPEVGASAEEAASAPFVLLVALIEAPVDLAYFVATEAIWGRSVGKLALGLRVVGEAGGRPTVGQAAVRNLLRFLWFVPLLGGVVPLFGVLFLVVDAYLMRVGEMDQRIGDLVAKTYVVRDGVWWPPEASSAGR